MPTMFYTQSAKVDVDLSPRDKKINRVLPLIIKNLHVNFESDWTNTVVCIVSTRFYTQSAKVDLDLWPCDPKSIVYLLSTSTTYIWSLKVIGLKLQSVSCLKGFVLKMPKLTLTCDPITKINRVLPLMINNLHVKFKSDRVETVVCRYRVHKAKRDGRTHPLTHSLTHLPIKTLHERPNYYIPQTLLRGDNTRIET